MATAVASGAVALVLDANERGRDTSRGRLTPNTVKALLEFTSFDVTGTDALTQGAGALNAAGAIELGLRITRGRPGTQWVASVPQPSTRIGSDQLPWTHRFLWGNRYAFRRQHLRQPAGLGAGHRLGRRPRWGDALVWGDGARCGVTPWSGATPWSGPSALVWGDSAYDPKSGSWANLAQSR